MGFATEIKPLFRESDRESMDWAFDLWSYDDVKTNAEVILERLEDESMPCDEPWDAGRIEAFRKWVADECPP